MPNSKEKIEDTAALIQEKVEDTMPLIIQEKNRRDQAFKSREK